MHRKQGKQKWTGGAVEEGDHWPGSLKPLHSQDPHALQQLPGHQQWASLGSHDTQKVLALQVCRYEIRLYFPQTWQMDTLFACIYIELIDSSCQVQVRNGKNGYKRYVNFLKR